MAIHKATSFAAGYAVLVVALVLDEISLPYGVTRSSSSFGDTELALPA